MEPDFSGWATRTGLRCSDGVTIMGGAFQHMDKKKVPLFWSHGHNKAENVLGHAYLENKDEGVRAHAFFNDTAAGKHAKSLVAHGDITALSIYANKLSKQGNNVVHGMIREVSLVTSPANPGAYIDYVKIAHGDGYVEDLEEEFILHTGETIDVHDNDEDDEDDENPDPSDEAEDTEDEEDVEHADSDSTVDEVFSGLSDEEKNVVYYLIASAVDETEKKFKEASASHSDNDNNDEGDLTHQEGADGMSRNVFDQSKTENGNDENKHVLSHSDMGAIFADAQKCGSLATASENFVKQNYLQHGITNIDVLFPDAKPVSGTIELEKRRTEWVAAVINGTRKTPFSRIKTFVADLTQDAARAKGYIKGNYKLEEWFGVTSRKTGPTTIYKKQKVDRDDILDITDFNMVDFLKGEMRLMTEEEFARAVLIGDGRSPMAEDKIKDPMGGSNGDGIRSILNDHELFVTTVYVNVDDPDSSYEEVVDALMDAREFYKGAGTPDFFTTIPELNKFMKARDLNGQRYYKTKQEVADAIGVNTIHNVEPMKEIDGLIGIIVNLDDYNIGTDRGGELTTFEDFDIDYNQNKYLMETRASGALVRPKTAIVIKKTAAASVQVSPPKPQFVASTGVVTIPTKTGVIYKDSDGDTLTSGPQTALAAGASTTVYAVPDTNYHFATNQNDSWEFQRPAS